MAQQKELPVTGPKGYLVWLATNQPKLYAQVRERLKTRVPANLSGLGFGALDQSLLQVGITADVASDPIINSAPQGASSTWADTLSTILKTVAVGYSTKQQIDAQNKINQMQLDRLRQGLPPLNIDPASYGLQTASASIGIAPNTQKMLMLGGAAVLGVWLLTSFTGRRRAHA